MFTLGQLFGGYSLVCMVGNEQQDFYYKSDTAAGGVINAQIKVISWLPVPLVKEFRGCPFLNFVGVALLCQLQLEGSSLLAVCFQPVDMYDVPYPLDSLERNKWSLPEIDRGRDIIIKALIHLYCFCFGHYPLIEFEMSNSNSLFLLQLLQDLESVAVCNFFLLCVMKLLYIFSSLNKIQFLLLYKKKKKKIYDTSNFQFLPIHLHNSLVC